MEEDSDGNNNQTCFAHTPSGVRKWVLIKYLRNRLEQCSVFSLQRIYLLKAHALLIHSLQINQLF